MPVLQYTNNVSSLSEASYTQPPPPPHNPLVLIVEDHDDSRHMLWMLLKLKGYEVIEAEDVEQALALLENQQPDLVLLNINLPIADAFTTLRRVREFPSLSDVPILLTSGYMTPAFWKEVPFVGCQEFLIKPLDFDKLDFLLDYYLPC
jgi:CheY-like chemotaxis protein